MTASSSALVLRAEKLIHTLGLNKFFDDERFIETVSDEVEKMFTTMNLSELMITAKLPEFLFSLVEVKRRIEVLPMADQKEVLRCLSNLILYKSNRNYGAEGKYGIQYPKRVRA